MSEDTKSEDAKYQMVIRLVSGQTFRVPYPLINLFNFANELNESSTHGFVLGCEEIGEQIYIAKSQIAVISVIIVGGKSVFE